MSCDHPDDVDLVGGRPIWYGLDGEPICVVCWEQLFNDFPARQIGSTTVGPMRVSTVWLGVDHGLGETGSPLIFETMIFGGALDQQDVWRYATRAEAEAGHAAAVELCRFEVRATE